MQNKKIDIYSQIFIFLAFEFKESFSSSYYSKIFQIILSFIFVKMLLIILIYKIKQVLSLLQQTAKQNFRIILIYFTSPLR